MRKFFLGLSQLQGKIYSIRFCTDQSSDSALTIVMAGPRRVGPLGGWEDGPVSREARE